MIVIFPKIIGIRSGVSWEIIPDKPPAIPVLAILNSFNIGKSPDLFDQFAVRHAKTILHKSESYVAKCFSNLWRWLPGLAEFVELLYILLLNPRIEWRATRNPWTISGNPGISQTRLMMRKKAVRRSGAEGASSKSRPSRAQQPSRARLPVCCASAAMPKSRRLARGRSTRRSRPWRLRAAICRAMPLT